MKRPRPAIRSYSGLILAGAVLFQVSFLPAQAPSAGSGQAITIAVVDFDGFGISQMEAIALTNRLRNELFKLGTFEVVDRGMMENILTEQDFQMAGCTSNECLVEVGQLLGAKQMIGGSISKVGNTFSISARLVDVETGKLIGVSDYDLRGEIDDMLTKGMRIVALMLSGDEAGAQALNVQQALAAVPQGAPPKARSQPNLVQRIISINLVQRIINIFPLIGQSQLTLMDDNKKIRFLLSRLNDFDYQLVLNDTLKMAMLEAQLNNPYIAAFLSLPPPPYNGGLGHAYTGNWLRGILFIGGAVGGGLLTGVLLMEIDWDLGLISGFGTYIGIWTLQVIDAWKGAKEYNQKLYNSIYLGK